MKSASHVVTKLDAAQRVLRLEPLELRSMMAADFSELEIWELSENRIQHHRLEGSREFRSTNFGPGSTQAGGLRFALQTTNSSDSIHPQSASDSNTRSMMGPLTSVIVVHGPIRPATVDPTLIRTEPTQLGSVPANSIAIIVPLTPFERSLAEPSNTPRFTLVLLFKNPQSVLVPIGIGRNLLVDSFSRNSIDLPNSPVSQQELSVRQTSHATSVDTIRPTQFARIPTASDRGSAEPSGIEQPNLTNIAGAKQYVENSDRPIALVESVPTRNFSVQPDVLDAVVAQITQPTSSEMLLGSSAAPVGILPLLSLADSRDASSGRVHLGALRPKDCVHSTSGRNTLTEIGRVGMNPLKDAMPIPDGMISLAFNSVSDLQRQFPTEHWMSATVNPFAAVQIFLRSENFDEQFVTEAAHVDKPVPHEAENQASEHSWSFAKVTGFLVAILWALFVARPVDAPQTSQPSEHRSKFLRRNWAWFKKEVRYRCAKHPHGRSGNGA